MKLSSLRMQLAVFLSLSLLVLWGATLYELHRSEHDAVSAAETQVRGISQAYAENTLSTVKRVDLILLELGYTWIYRPGEFLSQIKRQQKNIDDVSMRVSIVDRNGDLVFTNLGRSYEKINLADREHIRVHFGATESRLYISSPVKGRVSGKWSLQFTRPLLREGRFEGVIVLSVSPEVFSGFYRSASVGEKGTTLMVRQGGEVIARAPSWESYIGRRVTGVPYDQSDSPVQGNYRRYSQIDGIERIYGYYRLPDYGVTLTSGVATEEVLAPVRHQQRMALVLVAAVSSLLVIMAWLIWRSMLAREQACVVASDTAQELESYREHLEELVQQRTVELTTANDELRKTNRRLEEAQTMLLQSEKMASLGQLAAGVAHEINNPISFVSSNLSTMEGYLADFLSLVDAYGELERALPERALPIVELKRSIDYDFVRGDWGQMLKESRDGLNRVKKIVKDLKEFSHVESQEWAVANIHDGLESTLNIVYNELKYKAKIVKDYGTLPDVECLPGELNQVFMNILVNAAHAIKDKGEIRIRTGASGEEVWVEIEDTGSGISPENLKRIFDPFFTTKPVGKGTGLGLSLAYSIMRKHHGRIEVKSELGQGSIFRICLPQRQPESVEA